VAASPCAREGADRHLAARPRQMVKAEWD